MMAHEEKRVLRIPSFHPVEAFVRDDVGHVSFVLSESIGFIVVNEVWIPVFALIWDDTPIVEASGLMRWSLAQIYGGEVKQLSYD